VINTPLAPAVPVAECAASLIVALDRRIAFHDRHVRAGEWLQAEQWPVGPLQGRTLGLVGFGQVARIVMQRLSGFEFNVLVHDPFVTAETVASAGATAVLLDELLAQADFISLHCPLNDSTRHLIDERALGLMRRTAFVVTTSRGDVVDERALAVALQNGTIAGAALDVYEKEPLPADSPLCQLENVVLMPHTSSHTQQTPDLFRRLGVDSIIALSEGRWPLSCVNRNAVKPKLNLC